MKLLTILGTVSILCLLLLIVCRLKPDHRAIEAAVLQHDFGGNTDSIQQLIERSQLIHKNIAVEDHILYSSVHDLTGRCFAYAYLGTVKFAE